MDFDNRKVYCDTSITDGLVQVVTAFRLEVEIENADFIVVFL